MNYNLHPDLVEDMKRKGIDIDLTLKILNQFNAGIYDHVEPVKVRNIPEVDGRTILDMTGNINLRLNYGAAQKNIDSLGLTIDLSKIGSVKDTEIFFDKAALRRLGTLLYPVLAYGILNGGSASSYIDLKKNQDFNKTLFQICQKEFTVLAEISKGKAKGITPAFINQDGTPGPSFIELKMRALLIEILRYQTSVSRQPELLLPMFQMTSVYNDQEIKDAYAQYRESDLIAGLARETKVDITAVRTGVQPMLAAFSPGSAGKPKTIFDKAFGRENCALPMPGGHGQNFIILRDVYRELLARGVKFICLGNVDNLGFTVDPVSLAILALENKQAGFEFAFRTVVDVKGGVLIEDQRGRLNCADIGPAISKAEVLAAEKSGKKILFNCAIGLFNLKYLTENLDYIIENLPMRFSDQDKDAGVYSQAEQVTWEIIGILDDFLIFGVDKYERFLAAKMLLEGLMTSGAGLDNPAYPTDPDPEKDLKTLARKLNGGLWAKLSTVYGMKQTGGHWVPKTVAELKQEFK
ncbi:MAG: UTP--glucose-1-phosphate uridylyltransferase [Firmicutes bacterium]|nr:UTP--glucose-1-phosphate uridylyltransferase [Bacillota bacterium]